MSYNNDYVTKKDLTFSTNVTVKEELFSFIIEENTSNNIISNFFGEKISSVTAFIGKNGTGKTTNVCKPIMAQNWLTYDLIIFLKIDELLVFKNPLISKKIENQTKYKLREITISDTRIGDGFQEINSKSNEELNDFIRLYYSSSYTETPFDTKSINDDISTSGLIAKELSIIVGKESEGKIEYSSNDSFTNFKFNDLRQQIEFLESEIGKEFSTNLNLNTKINVSHSPSQIRVVENQFENIELFSEFENSINKNLSNGLIDITSLPGAPRIAIILWSFVYNISYTLKEEYLTFLRRKQINFYANTIELEEEDVNLNVFIGPLLELLNSIIDHIEDHFILRNGLNNIITNTSFSIPIEIGQRFINIHTNQLKEKINNYNFKWNISSGEYSYLSLFSRLYGSDYRIQNKYFLLVIDEGDTNFHPEWSRKYVNMLIKWIPKILSRAKSIQLVLTTHSPYVLSDLPASNVYTMKKENGKINIEHPNNSTFGANIHDLLANDFFMDEGFMGEFAKGKIQTVIDILNHKKISKKKVINHQEIWNIIQLIGDTFLKQKMSSMFLSKFENLELLEQELAKARAEVKRLENLNKKL